MAQIEAQIEPKQEHRTSARPCRRFCAPRGPQTGPKWAPNGAQTGAPKRLQDPADVFVPQMETPNLPQLGPKWSPNGSTKRLQGPANVFVPHAGPKVPASSPHGTQSAQPFLRKCRKEHNPSPRFVEPEAAPRSGIPLTPPALGNESAPGYDERSFGHSEVQKNGPQKSGLPRAPNGSQKVPPTPLGHLPDGLCYPCCISNGIWAIGLRYSHSFSCLLGRMNVLGDHVGFDVSCISSASGFTCCNRGAELIETND